MHACFSFYDFPGFSVFKKSASAICSLSFSRERALIRYGLICKSPSRKNSSRVTPSASQKYDSVSTVGLRSPSSISRRWLWEIPAIFASLFVVSPFCSLRYIILDATFMPFTSPCSIIIKYIVIIYYFYIVDKLHLL